MATPLFSLASQALPSLFSAFQRNTPAATTAPAAPLTGRAALVEEAKRLGNFEAKRNAYNQEALATGSPTMMDDAGNIVQREINPTDIMQMTAQTSGGNTVSMRPDVQARLMAMTPTYRTSGAADEQLFQAMKREMDEQNRRAAAGVQTMAPGVDVMTGKYGTGFAAPIGAVPSNMAAVLQKAREDEILSAGGMPATETVVAPTNIGKSLSSVLTQAWNAERAKKMAGGEKKEAAKPVAAAATAKSETKSDKGKPVAKTSPVLGLSPAQRLQAAILSRQTGLPIDTPRAASAAAAKRIAEMKVPQEYPNQFMKLLFGDPDKFKKTAGTEGFSFPPM